MKLDLNTLNDSQKQVVLLPPEKDVLTVAGPGSGKTRTLTYRIAHLGLVEGLMPSRLRAVTYTRAATEEMRERLEALSVSLAGVQISTIHRLCREIIKETQGATVKGGDFRCYVEGAHRHSKRTPQKKRFLKPFYGCCQIPALQELRTITKLRKRSMPRRRRSSNAKMS